MRVRIEQVLRGTVIVVLAVMLWQSLRQQHGVGGRTVTARGISGKALAEWSALAKAPDAIQVRFDSMPSKIERAWLGALAGAGSALRWSGDRAPVMMDAQPVASPAGGTKVLVAAPTGSSVAISDDVGLLDTLRAQNNGIALALNSIAGRLSANVKGSVASTSPRDSLVLHKVLVIGDAGWESKFLVAALEEEGWKVDAFIRVAPGVDVTQGSTAIIDTTRYSAVIALDEAASPYANRIIEYARTGGGVILAPQAASLDAMTPLRAGAVSRTISEAPANQAGETVNLGTIALNPITSLHSDAVVIDKRAGAVAIAARRIGAGRVLQLGYEDTWRWRMAGGDAGVRDHRVWWTRLVSNVAYAPRVPRATAAAESTDEAPTIGLVAAIGPRASTGATANLSTNTSDLNAWLFVLLALALIGEVTSRRLRGAS
jgi:hypothetical protein